MTTLPSHLCTGLDELSVSSQKPSSLSSTSSTCSCSSLSSLEQVESKSPTTPPPKNLVCSMNQQQQQQQQQQQPRILRFPPNPVRAVHFVPHMHDMEESEIQSVWYNRKEYTAMKMAIVPVVRQIIKAEEKDGVDMPPETNQQTARGLEYRTKKGAERRERNKKRAARAVLEEQERNYQLSLSRTGRAVRNDDRIRIVYKQTAADACQRAARELGLLDERVATQYYRQPLSQVVVPPPPPQLDYNSSDNDNHGDNEDDDDDDDEDSVCSSQQQEALQMLQVMTQGSEERRSKKKSRSGSMHFKPKRRGLSKLLHRNR